MQIKGQEPVLEGDLFNDIATEDSSWTIRKSSLTFLTAEDDTLTFELEKLSYVKVVPSDVVHTLALTNGGHTS